MTATFTDTWGNSYEGIPADTENINLGANRIRDLKVAVRERLAVDHSWNGDGNDGKHKQVQLRVAPATPALDPTDGCLFVKAAISGISELNYEDSNGNVTQLTVSGTVNTQAAFVSGTRLVFAQSVAPTGWVQNTGLNDQVLRAVGDASGGQSGGSWGITGLNATTVVAAHALTAAEIPAHTHQYDKGMNNTGTLSYAAGGQSLPNWQPSTFTTDGGTGGGGAHSHGASTNVSGDGSWRPAYVNVLVATKS